MEPNKSIQRGLNTKHWAVLKRRAFVYILTEQNPLAFVYSLTAQRRRAVGS